MKYTKTSTVTNRYVVTLTNEDINKALLQYVRSNTLTASGDLITSEPTYFQAVLENTSVEICGYLADSSAAQVVFTVKEVSNK